MAHWFLVEVLWTGPKPGAADIKALADLLARLDHDTHVTMGGGLLITTFGIDGLWRHPLLDLSQVMALCCAYGYPCRGHWREWRILEEEEDEARAGLARTPWSGALPDLGWLSHDPCAWDTVRKFSRRFSKFLPPKPVKQEPHRTKGRGGSRRGRTPLGG